MVKRISHYYACFLLLFILLPPAITEAGENRTALPEISAEAAVLLDWNSGRILYARDSHQPLPMASTTKIMTAIVALENGRLDEEITASPKAANTGGSSIWLEEGEIKTLEELLLGLMLRSGNDAAVAIAEHISGSVENFAKLMTSRAKELGAKDTNFCNPHGLHHPEHYTTAYDLALISAHGMGITEFRRIISTSSAVISWPGHPWDRYLYNENKLFTLFQGTEGIKTGWTTPAGRCFAGAAMRSGRRLVSIVLNAPQLWEDSMALLDYGFAEFCYKPLVKEGQYLKSLAVINGVGDKVKAVASKNFYYPLRVSEDTEENKVTYRFVINEPLKAPLGTGERIGELEVCFQGETVGLVDLLAGNEVKKIGFWENLKRKLGGKV